VPEQNEMTNLGKGPSPVKYVECTQGHVTSPRKVPMYKAIDPKFCVGQCSRCGRTIQDYIQNHPNNL